MAGRLRALAVAALVAGLALGAVLVARDRSPATAPPVPAPPMVLAVGEMPVLVETEEPPGDAAAAPVPLADDRGAVAAALAWTELAEASLAMAEPEAVEALRAASADGSAEALAAGLRADRAELAARFPAGQLSYRVAPLATRAAGLEEGRATVTVWYASVFSTPGRPSVGDFRTATYELVHERGAWRVAAESDVAGPRPGLPGAGPGPAGDLEAELAGFSPVGQGSGG